MDERNLVLHQILTSSEFPPNKTLKLLKLLQFQVDKAIVVAKTRWLGHLAETIHEMAFNPKEVWGHINLFSAGEKSHHST